MSYSTYDVKKDGESAEERGEGRGVNFDGQGEKRAVGGLTVGSLKKSPFSHWRAM
jgi:hypothetical protein